MEVHRTGSKWTMLLLAVLASGAQAQTLRPMLDYASAATIRDTCIAWANERQLKVAIAVYDERGTLIALSHMDGAATAVGSIAQWKGKSAATLQTATAETANWGRGPAEVATWEGGLPIFTASGTPLGGVGVSGAESDEDAACASAGIAAAGLRETAK